MQLTFFDLAVIGLTLLFGIRGAFRGIIAELAGLAGLVVGFLLARTFYPELSPVVAGIIEPDAAPLVAGILLFLAGLLGVALLARILQRVCDLAFLGMLDKILGLGVGLAKGLLLCCLIAYLAYLMIPHFNSVKNSELMPSLLDWAQRIAQAANLDQYLSFK